MISKYSDRFEPIKKKISGHKKILRDLSNLSSQIEKAVDEDERRFLQNQMNSLLKTFRENNGKLKSDIQAINLIGNLKNAGEKNVKLPSNWQSLPEKTYPEKKIIPMENAMIKGKNKPSYNFEVSELEKSTLRRLKKKEKGKKVVKEIKPSSYVAFSNKLFSGYSKKLLEKGHFKNLQRSLIKANMQMLDRSFVSVILFSTLLAFVVSILVFLFFLFFNFGPRIPFITLFTGDIIARAITVSWIIAVIPIAVFIFVYTYPNLERKSIETRIDYELPFATIHMASIAESKIEPSNIFRIMVDTGEYPNVSRELIKLMNEINIFGRDLVTALRNSAYNSPSKKLSELFDGLATTINSGGDLANFFEKRAGTLLFDYRLDKEKQTKSAETFMDIYISVVIAAPMILMLLLILIRISGLGIALSTGAISLIMALGVSFINVIFLVFLQLKSRGRS